MKLADSLNVSAYKINTNTTAYRFVQATSLRQSHIEEQAPGTVRWIALEKISDRPKQLSIQVERPQQTPNGREKGRISVDIIFDAQLTEFSLCHKPKLTGNSHSPVAFCSEPYRVPMRAR